MLELEKASPGRDICTDVEIHMAEGEGKECGTEKGKDWCDWQLHSGGVG